MKGVIYLRTYLIAIQQINVLPRTYAWEHRIALAKTTQHTRAESRWVESHLWERNSSVRRKCSLCSLVCVSQSEKGWKFPWRWKIGFCTVFIDSDSRGRTGNVQGVTWAQLPVWASGLNVLLLGQGTIVELCVKQTVVCIDLGYHTPLIALIH